MKTKVLACLLAASMLAGCTAVTTTGGTTYAFNAPQALKIVASIDSGFVQLLADPSVSEALGAEKVSEINAQLLVISDIQAKLAAASNSSITVDVQKNWVATAESAAAAALKVAEDVNSTGLIPAPASTIITALATLEPALATILGAVSAEAPTGLTTDQALDIIGHIQ